MKVACAVLALAVLQTAALADVLSPDSFVVGPAGTTDEFVEIYNNTDAPIVVQATDASNGWTVSISNGEITGPLFVIPNGTLIPARGHYLGGHATGYSLCNYPSGYGPGGPSMSAMNRVRPRRRASA